MNHQYLEVGQEVTYIGIDDNPIQAKITIVYGPDEARLEWDNGSAIASFSDKNQAGTFHFAEASSKAESTE